MNEPQNPSTPPERPPIAYPIPIPNTPGRPVWPTVIGVISVSLAGLGLICSPVSFVDVQKIISGRPTEYPYPEWFRDYTLVAVLFGMLMSVVLLVGGIQLLRRRPVARMLHLVYGWVNVFSTVVGAGIMIAAASSPDIDPSTRIPFLAGAIGGVVTGLAYPVFLLVWFYRRKMTSQIHGWERQDPWPSA
jgi:hypothetical protein